MTINNENKLGYLEVVIPQYTYIDQVMGDGVLTTWVPSCISHKFESCTPEVSWTDREVDLGKPIQTDLCVLTEGEYCGAQVIIFIDECNLQVKKLVDPSTCEIIDVPEGLEIGKCSDGLFDAQYEYLTITAQICSDDTEGLVHTNEDILAIINGSGELFNITGDVVNVNLDSQVIVDATVQTYLCDTNVKKSDGEIFTVIDDTACVTSLSGITIFQLNGGGSYKLGDAISDTENTVNIDESVIWPCGTGGVYCFTVKNTISEGLDGKDPITT